jgi:hypothetical protein
MVRHQVEDTDLRTPTASHAILVDRDGSVWAHKGRTAGEDSQAGNARRQRRSSRATFVVVMQTTDMGDCEDRATGWRFNRSVDGSILIQREVSAALVIIREVAVEVAA